MYLWTELHISWSKKWYKREKIKSKDTIILWDFNIFSSVIDRTSREKMTNDIKEQTALIMNLTKLTFIKHSTQP